jgi:hypothetical protein
MSSALTGNKIKDSYQALLKIGTNGSLDPTTAIAISDGLGNDTPLQLAADKLLTNYSGNNIGLNLDFANNYYEFGDKSSITGKVASLALVSDPNEAFAAIEISGNALNIREYGNIFGGDGSGMGFSDAIYENFGFTFDWKIDNNDISKYPFYKNTIINTFGGVETGESAMNNNFFANNSQLELWNDINFSNDAVLSNCFVFGLTTMVDLNVLNIFSRHAGTYNTNVAIFNGSGLRIGKGGNHIFSVNASALDFKDDVSGITVLGGDVYNESNGIYVTAYHSLSDNKCGINFTGHHAKGTNNLSNVFGYYNVAFGTEIGQVQIEQKQLFANCPDGSLTFNLVDTFENDKIYVENNTTYLVDAKFVSTNGNGDTGSSGNWTLYREYMICVDGIGNLSIINADIRRLNFIAPNQDVTFGTDTNVISFQVIPDTVNSAHCWVRAEIVLHKIKAV